MICLKPIEVHMDLRPCGQCMNCRINNKRKWTARILLESMFHLQTVFVTLTYNDEHTPLDEHGNSNLNPEDLKLFIKRLRFHYSGMNSTFRYFGVGEYGSTCPTHKIKDCSICGPIQRAHYHIILFGVGLDAEPQIERSWQHEGEPMGFTLVSELTPERAAYTAQYTTKKMTKIGDSRLGSRHPEFARMSNRYGIGEPACAWLAATMGTDKGHRELMKYGDVWNSVRIDGKIWPIAPYLRMKIRDRLGIPQNSRERAIFFEHFDYETGEIFPNLPLPEHYGPWADCRDQRFPANIRDEKAKGWDQIREATRKASKANRRSAIKEINWSSI